MDFRLQNLMTYDNPLYRRLADVLSTSHSATSPGFVSSHSSQLNDLIPTLRLLMELLYDESGPPVGALCITDCAEDEFKRAAQSVSNPCSRPFVQW